MFYSQFQLSNRAQKLRQIVIIKDAIYRVKTEFNETFDGTMLCKEQQIAKIKEKNKRRRKILEDLGRDSSCVIDPALGVAEQPEQLLLVQDDEVKVEKYISPEMQVFKFEQNCGMSRQRPLA